MSIGDGCYPKECAPMKPSELDLTEVVEAAIIAIQKRDYFYPEGSADAQVEMRAAIEAALPILTTHIGKEIAGALLGERITCPVHGIPDCSPLLNGCSLPAHLFRQRDVDAEIALNFGGTK